jgi:hypothetical protein
MVPKSVALGASFDALEQEFQFFTDHFQVRLDILFGKQVLKDIASVVPES